MSDKHRLDSLPYCFENLGRFDLFSGRDHDAALRAGTSPADYPCGRWHGWLRLQACQAIDPITTALDGLRLGTTWTSAEPCRQVRYFSSIPLGPGNTDNLFVVLTFSGGGTRAGALAYGVLDQLRRIKIGCGDPDDPNSCPGPTLLNELDVISSVSGGSFTAAYYARYGDTIFEPLSDFQKRFLHSNVQRELIGRAVYYPQSWLKLLGRPEIAADLYSDWLFHGSTYKDLTTRPRPFVILNASDFATQERVQFTQDKFDIICNDLSTFPLSRAVAASSAFPGLLNSMTVNTFNAPSACPVDRPEPSWLANARKNQFEHRPSYRQALAYDRLSSGDKSTCICSMAALPTISDCAPSTRACSAQPERPCR